MYWLLHIKSNENLMAEGFFPLLGKETKEMLLRSKVKSYTVQLFFFFFSDLYINT